METSPAATPAKLYAKLAAVMGALSRIPKDGRNTFHNYDYATAAAVADAIRVELAKQNVAFFAEMTNATLDSGIWVVEFEFTFACGDTGATVTKRWRGEAQAVNSKGRDDKGLNKAATAAEKYFLLKTFIVSTGDEPDPDADGEQPRRPNVSAVSTKRAESDAPSTDKPQMGFMQHLPQPWTVNEALAWANKWGEQGLMQGDVLAALGVTRLSEWTKGAQDADAAVQRYIDHKVQA